MRRKIAELQKLAQELEGTIPPLLEIGQLKLADAATKELDMINKEVNDLRAEIALVESRVSESPTEPPGC